MAFTSEFQSGVAASATKTQALVDRIYTARDARGLSNNSKPSFTRGNPIVASSIKTVIANCSGINYSSNILPSISDGITQISAYDMRCIEQVKQDLEQHRTCSSGCVGDCYQGCSSAGCSSSGCSGNCSSGCGNYCTSCDGSWAWSCVSNCGFDCAGTGSCKGRCNGSCTNGCTEACLAACGYICTNQCDGSCTSGCDNNNRIGSIANR